MNLFKSKNKNKFQKVSDYLSKIDCISFGGCGLAALALYDAAKLEGKNPEIIFYYNLYGDEDSFNINEQYLKGNSSKAASAWHIVVKVEDKYYDGNGLWDSSSKAWGKKGQVSTRELLIQSLITGSWNTMFDRKKWFPKIKQFCGWEDVDIPLENDGICGAYTWTK